MFIYCGNNPITRIDISGADSEEFDGDPNLKDEEEAMTLGPGGDGKSSGGYNGGKDISSSAGDYSSGGEPTHILPANNSYMTTDELIDLILDFLGVGYTEASPGRYVSADNTAQIRIGSGDLLGTHAGGPHVNFNILVPKYKNVHVYILD